MLKGEWETEKWVRMSADATEREMKDSQEPKKRANLRVMS